MTTHEIRITRTWCVAQCLVKQEDYVGLLFAKNSAILTIQTAEKSVVPPSGPIEVANC
jgi:hypothetical protein